MYSMTNLLAIILGKSFVTVFDVIGYDLRRPRILWKHLLSMRCVSDLMHGGFVLLLTIYNSRTHEWNLFKSFDC